MKKAGLPLGRPAFFIAEFSDLVHESPETLDFPLALHQVRGRIRRRLQKDLVHESPETLDFPLALHQVRDPIQRHPRPLGAILQKPGAKPSEPASNVLP